MFPRPEHAAHRDLLVRRIVESDPVAYAAAMRALVGFDARDRLAEIRAPTLVVTGARDTTVPPAVQAELARGIPGARHVVIDGGGHAVVVDQAEAFNRAVLEFLRAGDQGRPGNHPA